MLMSPGMISNPVKPMLVRQVVKATEAFARVSEAYMSGRMVLVIAGAAAAPLKAIKTAAADDMKAIRTKRNDLTIDAAGMRLESILNRS